MCLLIDVFSFPAQNCLQSQCQCIIRIVFHFDIECEFVNKWAAKTSDKILNMPINEYPLTKFTHRHVKCSEAFIYTLFISSSNFNDRSSTVHLYDAHLITIHIKFQFFSNHKTISWGKKIITNSIFICETSFTAQ